MLLSLLMSFRFGEASHPGPGCAFDQWSIGVVNPSGINRKAQSFAELPPGIWNVSETQATQRTFEHFRRELRFFSPALRSFHGAYATLRPHSETAGAWTGVAQIAACPMRPLATLWKDLEFSSGRSLISSFHCGSLCILGGCFYGPPTGPTYGSASALTSALLDGATRELVLGASGPRFIGGDFNVDDDSLPCFSLWQERGWKEVQRIAEERWNIPREPTSKGKTNRDQLWISPELQQWLTSVVVDPSLFNDHSVVYGLFSLPTCRLWQMHWSQPSCLDWTLVDGAKLDSLTSPPFVWNRADMTASFQTWSHHAEVKLRSCFDANDAPARCWGRGQTTRPVKRPLTHVPLGLGRSGEVQPKSSFACRQSHLWFKQLRRIQAFVQRASSASSHPALLADQCCTWNSILQAKGFVPNFTLWWSSRKLKHDGAPLTFPRWPPPLAIARAIFVDFEANFRQFESWETRQRFRLLDAMHHEHNKILYKQLRADERLPLERLVRRQSASITHVFELDKVFVDVPLEWHADAQWTLQDLPVQVTACGPQVFQLETDLVLAPGQSLVATQQLTQYDDLEEELARLWKPIWQKHQGLALSHWDRIVAFGSRFLPRVPPAAVVWTSSKVHHLSEAYKKKSARGPDAWSREDVAHLPSDLSADLANLYNGVQTDTGWPLQLTTGFVCSVRKTLEADTSSQFRPIVLTSFLYRLWATGVAKASLPTLAAVAPDLVFGYVPGRRATDIWWVLQACIESCNNSGEALLGFNADLIRCFNTLPRPPLFALLAQLGIDPGAIRAWQLALSQLERRFKILGHTGQPHLSCTGFPEGDPLSCLAMLAFNVALSRYLEIYSPNVINPAYVDNLQLLASNFGDLCHGIGILRTFMQAWDIQLDPLKSYSWASCAKDRSSLRLFGLPVKFASKDLGAQMVYSKLSRTAVAQQRLDAVSSSWQVLRLSSAPVWHKLLAVKTAVWPRALHGCENRLLCFSTLCGLRSKAMAALKWNRAGASPWVRWSLMQEPTLDPEFWQIWQCLSTFWRMLRNFELICSLWAEFVLSPNVPGQGPLHAVLQVLDKLDWCLDAQCRLWIRELSWNFLELSLAELKLLAVETWHQTVCAHLQHRQDFQGLYSIDVSASFSLAFADKSLNGLLALIQDGTFTSNFQKSKFSAEHSGFCLDCSQEDTLEHRALSCVRTSHIRARFPRVVAEWPSLPSAFTHHGLASQNPHLWTFWTALSSLSDLRQSFLCEPLPGATRILFVDGSCMLPESPRHSLASWAVVAVEPATIVAAGPLHGILQSIDRAEVVALHAAALWTLASGERNVAYSDSFYALRGFSFLREHGYIPRHWKHEDLWTQVLQTLGKLAPGDFEWRKVRAHADPRHSTGPAEDYILQGNDFADRTAKRYNQMRSSSFLDLHALFVRHDQQMRYRVKSQLTFLLELAQFELQTPTLAHDPEDVLLSQLTEACVVNDSHLGAQLFDSERADICTGLFPHSFVHLLASWLAGVDISAAHKRPVTILEILAAFRLTCEVSLPIPVERGGVRVFDDPGVVVCGGLFRHTCSGAVAMLKTATEEVFRIFNVSASWTETARPSAGILRPLRALVIGWPVELAIRVDDFLVGWEGKRPIRKACDLARPWA